MIFARRVPPAHSPVRLGALAQGWVTTAGIGNGDAVDRLARALRDIFGAETAIPTDSGTSALALAIRIALQSRSTRAVALPAYCCYDVATAAAAVDVPVFLYDIDPVTLGPDWDSLERVLRGGAGAAVVAHLFGLPVDLTRAEAMCRAAGAIMIEDAAQGAGGRWQGRLLGSHGLLSVLSFGRGKGITGGTGGALLARGVGAAKAVGASSRLGPAQGGSTALFAATAQWLLGRPSLYGLPSALPFLRLGETVYRPPHPLGSIALGPAVVALDSLQRLEDETRVRRAHARFVTERTPGLTAPQPLPGADAGYLRFPFLLDADASTDEAAMLGITRGYPLALVDLPELAGRCRNASDAFPGARLLAARLVTAPTHSRLTDRDLERVVAWIMRHHPKALT